MVKVEIGESRPNDKTIGEIDDGEWFVSKASKDILVATNIYQDILKIGEKEKRKARCCVDPFNGICIYYFTSAKPARILGLAK